ncbi:MAG: hypothetical protein HRU32_07100 [Rhodobacteraceae bacterium]|nr:hypothetical protein [Paracoccaceae bacterium]
MPEDVVSVALDADVIDTLKTLFKHSSSNQTRMARVLNQFAKPREHMDTKHTAELPVSDLVFAEETLGDLLVEIGFDESYQLTNQGQAIERAHNVVLGLLLAKD